jgi:hypothetical protein
MSNVVVHGKSLSNISDKQDDADCDQNGGDRPPEEQFGYSPEGVLASECSDYHADYHAMTTGPARKIHADAVAK